MKFKIASAALFACIVSLPAHATLVEHYGYSLNTDTDIVTGGGLEWLQWDETVNTSISGALTTYSASGWRLASNIEMAALFNAWDFGAIFGTDEAVFYTGTQGHTGTNISPASQFIDVFGRTDIETVVSSPLNVTTDVSQAFYGADLNGNGLYNKAKVMDQYYVYSTGGSAVSRLIDDGSDMIMENQADARTGIALVRSVQTVPSPSTLVLFMFASALLGFFEHRRKKQA